MAYNGTARSDNTSNTNHKGYARPSGSAAAGGKPQQQAQQQAPANESRRAPREILGKTGLFASTSGVKAIAGVQLKQDLVLPAGTYINLYDNSQDEKRTDKSPVFGLEFVAGQLKSK